MICDNWDSKTQTKLPYNIILKINIEILTIRILQDKHVDWWKWFCIEFIWKEKQILFQ